MSDNQFDNDINELINQYAKVINLEIKNFILQSQTNNLKTSAYPKDFSDLDVKFSFGMGTPAKITWVSVIIRK